MKQINKQNDGFAHLTIIILLLLIVGVGSVGYLRINKANNTSNRSVNDLQAEELEALPNNLDSLKTMDEIEQIAGADDSTSIIKFVLESKDGKYVYKVVLSNGKKLVIDASTGGILSEETTDVSDDDKIPTGVQVTISPAEAYRIAAAKSSSPIKSIEMEVEDKKVVYKIEYRDGSKVEINASSGSVLKSEIKEQKEEESDEKEDDNEDREDEEEDHSNEDSDDSRDTEDHEEEDR